MVYKTDPLEAFFEHISVSISNQLPNGAPFTIHCKSKDDDLGTHVIGAGQSYEFSFRINFWETTLFFCGLGKQGGHVDFDIYKVPYRCDDCKWQVRGDAVVGLGMDPDSKDIVIPWK
ncbi:hypothetical protein CRG98_015367 [Punica granatum]|uniref:S-protein homolog n=1 Tax=Punica granatum TaxID=22663 RepID=A0A2I0K6T9_PUNGR|nr:hypothetical protein CRG98_015367 [Punica granatum]